MTLFCSSVFHLLPLSMTAGGASSFFGGSCCLTCPTVIIGLLLHIPYHSSLRCKEQWIENCGGKGGKAVTREKGTVPLALEREMTNSWRDRWGKWKNPRILRAARKQRFPKCSATEDLFLHGNQRHPPSCDIHTTSSKIVYQHLSHVKTRVKRTVKQNKNN